MLKKIMGFLFILVVVFCFVGCSNNEYKHAEIGRDGVYFYIDDVNTRRSEAIFGGTLYTLHLTSDKSKQKGKFKDEYKDEIGYIVIDDQIKLKYARGLFQDFKFLVSIDGIENLDVSNVYDMSYMFHSCSCLQNLDLSKWDVSNVTNMHYMFRACDSLKTLNISNWNVAKVTDMESMFNNCQSLQTIDISNWDVSNVITMDGMFSMCKSLQTLDISKWNVSKVDNMVAMFLYCSSLKTLDISKWNVSKVTEMSTMFYDCKLLTSTKIHTQKSLKSDFYSKNRIFCCKKKKNVV